MQKKFLLDTSIFLYDPQSLFNFDEHEILIPITVIEELDNFTRGKKTINQNAREVTRELEKLRQKGDLKKGVELPEEGSVRILHDNKIDHDKKNDNVILEYAQNEDSILVSKDMNLRIQAEIAGLKPEDYTSGKTKQRTRPIQTINMSKQQMEDIYQTHSIEDNWSLNRNEYAIGQSGQSNCLLRKINNNQLKSINVNNVYNISPKNKEQHFALDALMDESIELVALSGKAGTGKTLLSMAAGLEKVVNQESYDQMLVARPTVPMGQELGFLPGNVKDKMQPWMKPIYDNLEYLTRNADHNKMIESLKEFNFVDMEPLTYIRGRSIPNRFLVIDEAQNASPHEIKTAITRAGEGTKIVLTGDPYQIDANYLDEHSNALSYVIENMEGEPEFAFVNLIKGERSNLAEKAAKKL